MDVQDVLHSKALDQVSHLLGSYEAGYIGPEAFKVGIETIWACLGGVVDTDAFKELMQEANAEVAALPPASEVTLFNKGSSVVALMRANKIVRLVATPGPASVKVETLDDETDAVARTRKLKGALSAKGYEEFNG